MVLDVPGTRIGDVAEENDLVGLQPGHHLPIAVHKQLPCVLVFHHANGGHGHCAAFRFAGKAPRIAVPVDPADRRNDLAAETLPVSTQQVFAPVVIDVHSLGIIGEHGKVRGQNGLEVAQEHRVSGGVVPYALEQIVVKEKMYAKIAAGSLLQGSSLSCWLLARQSTLEN